MHICLLNHRTYLLAVAKDALVGKRTPSQFWTSSNHFVKQTKGSRAGSVFRSRISGIGISGSTEGGGLTFLAAT